MSSRRPARTRLIIASILAIVAMLATLVVLITLRYRDGLEQRLRTNLTSGAAALRLALTPAAFKAVIGSLTAEGISVELAPLTAPGGTLPATPGEALLTVHELIPVDGRNLPATLTGSRAGIDRQVRSLEITEAIGGVIALALLVALARVLVLLDRAVIEARASEAAMRTFLADASHELRTPVAALQATAERLLRDQPARPARDAIEAQLARDSGRLGRLIDDLLNLARLDARERPHHEPVDLADLASAAVAATRTTDPAHASNSSPPVPFRPPVTATRYFARSATCSTTRSRSRTRSWSKSRRRRTVQAMSVTDNGPGVPADQRERIFEPFVRLPAKPAPRHGPRARDRPPDDRITRRHDHVRPVPDRRRPIHATTTVDSQGARTTVDRPASRRSMQIGHECSRDLGAAGSATR